jgi:hypothetical protein
MFLRVLAVCVAALLLGLAGLVHGVRTDRWGTGEAMQEASAQLENLPTKIGTWESTPLTLDARQLEIGQIASHCSRTYKDQTTGDQVNLLIVCGRPGAIAVHTPDVCYQGAGYQMTGDPTRQMVPAGKDQQRELWTANFAKTGPIPDAIRIFWGWSTDGRWEASNYPRLSFARYPVLYKMYLIVPAGDTKQPVEDLPVMRFTEEMLPVLQHTLSH